MKKLINLALLFSALLALSQTTRDTVRIIEIEASYANFKGLPLTIKKDSLYRFKTAEIYLINKQSFIAMKNIYQNTIKENDNTKELVKKYARILKKNIDLERKLTHKLKTSDTLSKRIDEKNALILKSTQKAVDDTLFSLDKITKSVAIIENEQQQFRQKNIFEKIFIGTAGLGIGILIGLTF